MSTEIVKLFSEIPISELETLIKDGNIIDEALHYTTVIMSNCAVEYRNEMNIREEMEFKKMFITEGTNIMKNFSKIISKYTTRKPKSFVNIDFDSPWYANEPTFINEGIVNPFENNVKISKILTVICKLVDFINNHYVTQLKFIDQQNQYLKHRLLEIRERVSAFEFMIISSQLEDTITEINTHKKNITADFKEFHASSDTIHQYYLNLFSNRKDCLNFLPISILNIFQSSVYFISDDTNFLSFIVNFESWLPSEYRSTYGSEIIKLLFKSDATRDVKLILRSFSPSPELIIDDIITLYNKNKTDLNNITIMNYLFSTIYDKINFQSIAESKILLFVSIQLSLISKCKKEEIGNDEMYENITYDCLKNIDFILSNNRELLKTYLIYQIPTQLLSMYEKTFDDLRISELIDNIFLVYVGDKLSLIYLATILDKTQIDALRIPLTVEQKNKLSDWCKYYKYLNENTSDEELIDPITSTIIVKPCVLPIDEHNFCICDKYVTESYLWESKQNPYTRSALTVEELISLNKQESNVLKIKSVHDKLKVVLDIAKKNT